MRAVVASLAAVVVVGGCGGSDPHLRRTDVQPLVALTSRIAHEGACAQARDIATVRTRALRLVNEGRVPAKLQESFLSGVNALGAQAPTCVPTVKPEPAAPARHHGKGKEHGKGDEGD